MTNVPPSKARKIKKGSDVKLEDIFSDGEIVLAPRKSIASRAFDDDEGSELDGNGDGDAVAPSKSRAKSEMGHAPDAASFKWSTADIPSLCPEIDCDNDVVANPSPGLAALFHNRARLIHDEGSFADGVFRINIKICAANEIERANERKRLRAVKRGLVDVDFQMLANRVWDLKDVIDPLMSGPEGRKENFVWTNLLGDMKEHDCSPQQLIKGKSIPPQIMKAARPGR
jgi:hypothetical protein